MSSEFSLPTVPAKHSDFLRYVQSNPGKRILGLVKPYNDYDAVVRKIYAQEPNHPKTAENLLNLAPLFDEDGSADLRIRARDPASEPDELKAKYLLPLTDEDRKPNGSPAAVSSLKQFQTNFNVFSESSLVDLDWSNVIAAGSAVTTSLLPVPDEYNGSKRGLRQFYHEKFAPASDVDLFIYGLTEEQAVEKIKQIEARIRDSILAETTTVRTKNAITIVSQYPTRHIQIVLRLYKSIAEVLTGFDVDCSCAAYDGNQVYLAPRAIGAFITQVNHVDLSRRSPSYENRLSKYSRRGFEVFWPDMDRSRIDPTIFERSFTRTVGLARLLVLEKLPTSSDREIYLNQRRRERGRPVLPSASFSRKLRGNIKNEWDDEVPEWQEEDSVSDYHTFTIPYGVKYHARKIEKLLFTKDLLLNAEWNRPRDREVNLHRHPAFFGNADDVMQDCCGYCPEPVTSEEKQVAEEESKTYVSGPIGFLKDNPGRQEIGSFTPITETDWTEMAYVGNTEGLCQAIVDNDLDDVKQWLSRGIDVNRRDYTGRTPLQLATMASTPEVVQYLVDNGARLIARLADGRTALHLAAARGDVKIVKILLTKSEENEEEEDRKEDARKEAKRRKQEKERADVEEDADIVSNASGDSDADDQSFATGSFVKVNPKDDESLSALPDDANDQDPDIYDINVVAWDTPMSPLHLAIVKGHVAVVEELVASFGADVLLPIKLVHRYSKAPRAAILTLVLALNLPIHQAKLMTAKLLQLGASPSQADVQSKTPLYYFAGFTAEYHKILDIYLQHDQPAVERAINALSAYNSHPGDTESPLMVAIRAGNVITAMKLLEAGARVEITSDDFIKSVKASLGRVHKNAQTDFDTHFQRPVVLAVEADQPSVAMELLARGADPNTLHWDGHRVLQMPHMRRYTKGYSLLDCVKAKIECLRSCNGDEAGVNSQAPEPLDLDDNVYLEGLQEGTYRHWSARLKLADARKRFTKEQEGYEKKVEKAKNARGRKEKMAAVKDLLQQFEKLERELSTRGAKEFKEMHPDIKRPDSGNNNSRNQMPTKFKVECTFSANDLTDARKDGYFKLFEAAWKGDVDTIKSLTLSTWGPNEKEPPLEIGIRDSDSFNAFSIAVIRGHLEVAKDIIAISLAQYKPKDGEKNVRYGIRTSGTEYDEDGYSSCMSEDDDSEGIHLETRIIDAQFTVDDVGAIRTQVESKISPLNVLATCGPINYFLEKEQQPTEQRVTSLVEYALLKDDVDLLVFLIDLGLDLRAKLSTESSRINYSVEPHQFKMAMKLGRLRCLAEIIKRTGAGLPLDKLAEDSGVKIKEKPKYYQGLSIRGTKRADWVAAGRGISVPRTVNIHPPLLVAAREGNLETVEWLLGTAPARHYLEFAKAHKNDKRLKLLSLSNQGTEQSINNWLNSRRELVLHCAVLGLTPGESEPLVEYLAQNMPQCLEIKSADGHTPLSLAFYLRRLNFAKILVRAGANQTVRDKEGNNLLHLLLRRIRNPDEDDLKSLQSMLELIDPLLIPSMLTERSSRTPGSLTPLALWMSEIFNITRARSYPGNEQDGNLRVLQILLDFAKSTGQKHLELLNGAGNTVVHDAVKFQLTKVLKIFLERRPDLLYRENATGSTPLEVAEDAWVAAVTSDPPNPSIIHGWWGRRSMWASGHRSQLINRSPETFVDGENEKSTDRSRKRDTYDTCLSNSEGNGNRKRRLVTLYDANEVAKRLAQGMQAKGLYQGTYGGWRGSSRITRMAGRGGGKDAVGARDEVSIWLH